MEPEVHKRSEK